ncbi:hypothetical protein ACFYXM_35990 [Streptomyces sp. NPDC002476]|uniref:hypothetical protein n=1 Tax=Streptomyces sp. NPDC002476 TaxID=3364648 RepID=UPI003689FAD4
MIGHGDDGGLLVVSAATFGVDDPYVVVHVRAHLDWTSGVPEQKVGGWLSRLWT